MHFSLIPSISQTKEGLSKKEVEDLLKRGAYGALMDDDEEGDEFCEEDIDNILKKRTQVIRVEGGEKGSTFSKATFSTSATRYVLMESSFKIYLMKVK